MSTDDEDADNLAETPDPGHSHPDNVRGAGQPVERKPPPIPEAASLADTARRERIKTRVLTELDFLSDRDKAVLTMLYGLEDGQKRTRDEVGEHFGITGFWVSMIVSRAMRTVSLVRDLIRSETSRSTPGTSRHTEERDQHAPDRAPALDDLLPDRTRRERLNDELRILTEVEREVLIRRFGLDNDEPRTLQDVGDALEMTREETRRIEMQAVRKLRRRGLDPDAGT